MAAVDTATSDDHASAIAAADAATSVVSGAYEAFPTITLASKEELQWVNNEHLSREEMALDKIKDQKAGHHINELTKEHIAIGILSYHNSGQSTLAQRLLNDKIDFMKSEKHPVLSVHEAQIFKCASPSLSCYRSTTRGHVGAEFCACAGHESQKMVLSRDMSVVVFPDKTEYTSTILGGMCMVDGVLILSDAKCNFNRLPTLELLSAASVLNKRVVLVQSLTDVKDIRILEHQNEITELISRAHLSEHSTIPVSAMENSSIELLCKEIDGISIEKHDCQAPVKMVISDSSIEHNGAGEVILTIHGRILKGILKRNQQVEIRPGLVYIDNGQPTCNPIIITIASLEPFGGMVQLEQAIAGVMVALKTKIDYYQVGHVASSLSGHFVGDIGSLPDVFSILQVKISLFPLIFNSYTEEFEDVQKIKEDEMLLLIIGMQSADARVRKIIDNSVVVVGLTSPICGTKEEKILVLRQANVSWRLIGHGEIVGGKPIRTV